MAHPGDNSAVLKTVDEIRSYEYDRGADSRDAEVAALQQSLTELQAEFDAYKASHPDVEEPPDPEPEPVGFKRRMYICQQVSTTAELNNYKAQFTDAKKTVPAGNALSVRWPWKSYEADPKMAQAGLDLAKAIGVPHYALRSMAGKHTPTGKMGQTITEDGVTYPSPFTGSKGAPNTAFLDALEAHNRILAKFLSDAGLDNPILQWTWYAKEWAEIYHGPAVRSAAGYSIDNFIAAHNAIIDRAAAVQADFPKVMMGLQLSGHGPIASVKSETKGNVVLVGELVKHACTKFKPGRAIIHANGWSYQGQWGQSNPEVDKTMDAAFVEAEKGGLHVGMQAIQPWGQNNNYPQYTASQVDQAFAQAEAVKTDSIELYTPSWLSANGGSVWKTPTADWISAG